MRDRMGTRYAIIDQNVVGFRGQGALKPNEPQLMICSGDPGDRSGEGAIFTL